MYFTMTYYLPNQVQFFEEPKWSFFNTLDNLNWAIKVALKKNYKIMSIDIVKED